MSITERFSSLLNDPEGLTRAWRTAGELDDDASVAVVVGSPEPEQLQSFSAFFERALGVPFPPTLTAALGAYNGVFLRSAAAPSFRVVPAQRLSEPDLWPLEFGDLDLFDALEVDGLAGAKLVPFAEIADSGWFAFAATEADPPVYWIDREFSTVRPFLIAPSVGGFFAQYCDASLKLSRVLKAARVPGWGG